MEANQLTPEGLAAIRERESKATPGPWAHYFDKIVAGMDRDGYEFAICGELDLPASRKLIRTRERNISNADFIAAARTDIPRLLATVEALRAENERLKTKLSSRENEVVFLLQRVTGSVRDRARNLFPENYQ